MKSTLPPSQAANQRHQQTLKTMFVKTPTLSVMSDHLDPPFVRWVCLTVQAIFEQEPNILFLSSPVNICGDIHGQFNDLASIFKLGGTPPEKEFLFLGDYVDRGKHSLEVILLLFCMKIMHPEKIFLLRGNHESREMTRVFGFADECRAKINKTVHKYFCQVFNRMPLCAVIDNRVFCVHGGIGPDIHTLDEIKELDRFCEVPDDGPMSDLVWSDPCASTKEWAPSDRGDTFLWGLSPAKKFLVENQLDMIVRGHQVAKEGFDFPFTPERCVVTVFSASCYDDCGNRGCYMTINPDGTMTFTELPVPVPTSRATSRVPASLSKNPPKSKRGIIKKGKKTK